MRLNVLCWPEGVRLQPSSWIPSPQPRTRSAFGRVPQISVAFSCERAGTQWKALTRLLEDLCAHGDICLSSGFGIWSFKRTCLPMQLCQAVAPDFPVIPASEVWLQGWFWFHSLSSHQQWQNISGTFLLPGLVSTGGTDYEASPLTQTRVFGIQLWQKQIWSTREIKQEKRLRLENITSSVLSKHWAASVLGGRDPRCSP